MVKKEKITLSVDSELWKEVRHYCVDNGNMQVSSFVEQLAREKLSKKK